MLLFAYTLIISTQIFIFFFFYQVIILLRTHIWHENLIQKVHTPTLPLYINFPSFSDKAIFFSGLVNFNIQNRQVNDLLIQPESILPPPPPEQKNTVIHFVKSSN